MHGGRARFRVADAEGTASAFRRITPSAEGDEYKHDDCFAAFHVVPFLHRRSVSAAVKQWPHTRVAVPSSLCPSAMSNARPHVKQNRSPMTVAPVGISAALVGVPTLFLIATRHELVATPHGVPRVRTSFGTHRPTAAGVTFLSETSLRMG